VLALASIGQADERERLETAMTHVDALSFDERSGVVLALAGALSTSDDAAERERAVELLRGLGDVRPSAAVVDDADARASAIALTLPAPRRRALRTLGTTHALARAEAIARTNAHDDARRAFHAIAASASRSDPARCAALMGEGRSLYRARDRAAAAEHLDAAATQCGAADDDVVAWTLYFAAKSYAALGQDEIAVARYDTLAARCPGHRLVDDAGYEAAAIELRAGDVDAARVHLRAVIDGPADADMRPDALFLLGWTERQAGGSAAALAAFDAAVAEGAAETREDLGGRIAYWRARTLSDLGRADEASVAFDRLARERPLSYYGRHARGRLLDLGTEIETAPVPETAATFAERPLTSTPGFARALACLRAGETAMAERELDALGLTSTGTDTDGRWLAVALLSNAGASERAISRTRGTLVRGLLGQPIDARTRALFALAYPRGYADAVQAGAEGEHIPSALVFGLIREESSFSAGAISIAHAYGLMQLITPTARRLARPLGLPSDAASLVRPEINVRLGTRYLGELHSHYAAGPEVIPAAYNAGQAAVDRWLRERGDGPLDEFVESIPYAETRGYTRRVIQSWGIYAFLETGRIEPLGHTLPTL
jgi:soluble lytic murein transglycosylase